MRDKATEKRRTLDRRQARALKMSARISAAVGEHARKLEEARKQYNLLSAAIRP